MSEVPDLYQKWCIERAHTDHPPVMAVSFSATICIRRDANEEGREIAYSAYLRMWPVVNALIAAVEDGPGTSYNSEDDDIGERTCCHVVSYHNHLEDCWYLKAEATIKELGLPAGLYATP